jgi:hypothetical protein
MKGRFIMLLVGVAGVLLTSAIVPAQVPPAPPAPPPAVPAPAPPVIRIQVAPAPAVAKKAVAAPKGVMVKKAQGRIMMPALPMAGFGGPQIDEEALVEQFAQQYRPILQAELHRARTVCKLSDEQRRDIAREAEWVIKDAAQRTAELQQRMMRGRRVGGPNPDPSKVIPEGFARIIRDHLTPDQAGRYRAEVESRAAEEKRAAVRDLVAMLDAELILSAEQRDKLTESLSSRWDDAWGRAAGRSSLRPGFVPFIPDPLVSPFLDQTQQAVWRAIPKQQLQGNFAAQVQFNHHFNGMVLEEGLEEDVAPARVLEAVPE